MHDPMMHRLQAADPLNDIETASDVAHLRSRVLGAAASAAPQSRPRTKLRRNAAVAAGVATAASAALALAPSDKNGPASRLGLPNPVAALAAQLDQGLLHVSYTETGTVDATGHFTPAVDPERADGWYTTDGTSSRTSYFDVKGDPVAEAVRRHGTVYVFNPSQGLVQRYPTTAEDGGPGRWLLELRKGLKSTSTHLIGRTKVRGIAAYELAYDSAPGDAYANDHRAYVAIDGGKLLRVDALNLPLPKNADAHYPGYERIEVSDFAAGPLDAHRVDPSPQFRDHLEDEPAQPAPVHP